MLPVSYTSCHADTEIPEVEDVQITEEHASSTKRVDNFKKKENQFNYLQEEQFVLFF